MFDGSFEECPDVAPQPIALKGSLAPAEPYPIEALSTGVRAAIEAIVDVVQVPPALAAQSVLAAAALTAQCDINIEPITGYPIPVSLFLVTVAQSGDRKSSSDRRAVEPIKEYERYLHTLYEVEKHDYAINQAAFTAATRKATNGANKSRADIRAGLEDAGKPPIAPPVPLLICDEPTAPGLQRLFVEAYPSLGLFSDEGAAWLGGYSMQDEQQAATGAMLSKLWDGQPIKRVRAAKDETIQILHGRRLSLHLMVQPTIVDKLFGSKEVRAQGLLSRLLVAQPTSLRGTRMWKEPDQASLDALENFRVKMGRRLSRGMAFKDNATRELDLTTVKLTPEARAVLIQFSDHCEKQARPGGPYEEIGDFASKMTENATRIAAVLAHYEGAELLKKDGLSANAANAGARIVQFYAGEALRLYGAGRIEDDADNAQILIDFIRKRGLAQVGKQWLSQNAPKAVRPAQVLSRAITLLVEYNHLVEIKGGAVIDHGAGTKWFRDGYTVIAADPA
jgi:hypothetical protein